MPCEVTVDVDESLAGAPRRALEASTYRALCERVLAEQGVEDAALSLLLGGDALLRRLNREHRGIDEPADVLSFPAHEGEPLPAVEAADEPSYLGDIAVSVEAARRQAAGAGLSLDEELRHLVLHGLLHLLGHDHETAEDEAAMRASEEAVLGTRIHGAARGHRD